MNVACRLLNMYVLENVRRCLPRTPYAPTLPPVPRKESHERPLLLFYAGWNYGVRMELVNTFKNDAEMVVRQSVPPAEYVRHILSAKFCPICGGFSQWTPRLAEALFYGCVPVLLSAQMTPPSEPTPMCLLCSGLRSVTLGS